MHLSIIAIAGAFLGTVAATGSEEPIAVGRLAATVKARDLSKVSRLAVRQGCVDAGFGVCPNIDGCCPIGGECCGSGGCCNPGFQCWISHTGAPGCCPEGEICS